jgi:hypothetical protein
MELGLGKLDMARRGEITQILVQKWGFSPRQNSLRRDHLL